MMTRRRFLRWLGSLAALGAGLAAYAGWIEPAWRLRVVRYRLSLPAFSAGPRLKIAVLTDFHASEPYMGAARIADIVAWTNAERPDLVLMLGDYEIGHRYITRRMPPDEFAGLVKPLAAPLGVHAILGNHDWWADDAAQRSGHGPVRVQRALEGVGIGVLDNGARRLVKDGRPFWLLGLGDQIALFNRFSAGWRHAPRGRRRGPATGVDDLAGTLAKLTDDAPAILLAHEPDIFPEVPARVALTLSGHTHGGQVRLAGWSPVVPSRFGNRYAYGHVVEEGRHLLVGGGLGCSIVPVRFGMPPEIAILEIGP